MSKFDSELLVVCHCYKHPSLFYRLADGSMIPLGSDVTYVDPACPELTWDRVPDESKQYVFGMHCPIATGIHSMGQNTHVFGTNILLEILKHAWRVLKRGGKAIFPGGYEIDKNKIAAFQSIIDAEKDNRFKHKWTFSIEQLDKLPIDIGKSPKRPEGNQTAAVFTKPLEGGGRKRKSYRRLRVKRLRTRRRNRRV